MIKNPPAGPAARRQRKSDAPTPRMVAAFNAFLDGQGSSSPFRRSDVEALVYPMTTPRNLERANAVAATLIADAARAGHLVREGHLHWKRAATANERQLRSGRRVQEATSPLALTLTTRCPSKWASVDLETGEVWLGSAEGWRRATGGALEEVRACL